MDHGCSNEQGTPFSKKRNSSLDTRIMCKSIHLFVSRGISNLREESFFMREKGESCLSSMTSRASSFLKDS